jgi:hypothetical protein
MKFGPLIAIVFAFFLIAVYPYYADDDVPKLVVSDDDGDGVTNDKDRCPEEDASGKDVDEDGCIDSEMSKEEIDYIEKIAKYNLGQYFLFAALSLLGTAIYWEREKLRAVLYENEDDLDFSKFTEGESTSDLEESVDYDDLGAAKEYDGQTESFFSRINLSLGKLNEEADRGTQIICVIGIVGLLIALGTVGELSWFQVEGTKEYLESSETFEARHYSTHLEYSSSESNQALTVNYESSRCTDEVDKFYNCDYRKSLFGTINTLLSLSLFLCFFALLLAFRAQKYMIWIAAVFSITLVMTMASLLLFTALIDDALISDEHSLDQTQEAAAGCWMSEPVIWGKGTCVSLGDDGYTIERDVRYTPGVNFFIVLICASILFVGLFTNITPMITMESLTWRERIRNNWQIFAIIFAIIFLWRLSTLMTNL